MPSPELIIDTETDLDKENSYCISPDNLNQLRFVRPNSFSKATIRNCNVTKLTSFNLQSLFNSLEKGSTATIIIDQPVLVLQEYDANAIVANAELAGFKNIKSSSVYAFCHGLGTKVETISLTLTK